MEQFNVYFKAAREGGVMTKVNGKVAFPSRRDPRAHEPNPGETWTVEIDGQNAKGSVIFLRLIESEKDRQNRRSLEIKAQRAVEGAKAKAKIAEVLPQFASRLHPDDLAYYQKVLGYTDEQACHLTMAWQTIQEKAERHQAWPAIRAIIDAEIAKGPTPEPTPRELRRIPDDHCGRKKGVWAWNLYDPTEITNGVGDYEGLQCVRLFVDLDSGTVQAHRYQWFYEKLEEGESTEGWHFIGFSNHRPATDAELRRAAVRCQFAAQIKAYIKWCYAFNTIWGERNRDANHSWEWQIRNAAANGYLSTNDRGLQYVSQYGDDEHDGPGVSTAQDFPLTDDIRTINSWVCHKRWFGY